jgi:hypothetical protein
MIGGGAKLTRGRQSQPDDERDWVKRAHVSRTLGSTRPLLFDPKDLLVSRVTPA